VQAPLRNLHEWLRRIGVPHATQQPDYANSVQPVEIVSDASALVSPLLPPSAVFGRTFTTAAVVPAFKIQAGARPCFVRSAIWGAAVITLWEWSVRARTAALANPMPMRNMTADPVLAVASAEGIALGAKTLGVAFPSLIHGNNGSVQLEESIFLRPGQEFVIEGSAAATTTYLFSALVTEAPVE
jgi:hypothetical protein